MVSKTEKLELMTRLANTVRDYIAEGIPQARYGRLKKSMGFIVNQNRVIIFSRYYWMRAINDGRGPITKKPDGPPLIYYKDPFDDPRIELDYPRKPNQVIKLKADQLKNDKKAGKVIFAYSVGKTVPLRFIEAGIIRFRKEAPKELRELIRGRTRKLLRRAGSRSRLTVVL